MSTFWMFVWTCTKSAALVVGLGVLGLLAVALIVGTFTWIARQYLGWVNSEISQLRKFNRAAGKKLIELCKDERFTVEERNKLFAYTVACYCGYEPKDEEEQKS